jgi:hypothetical protein
VTIWEYPNAPRPVRPYCSIRIGSVVRIGEPYHGTIDASGIAQVLSQREVVLSIVVYEDRDNTDPRSALLTATDLRDSLDLYGTLDTLKTNGWAYRGVELLQDTPELLDTGFEPRATFDVRFGVTIEQSDDMGWIETVIFTGDIENQTTTREVDLTNG